MFHPPPKPDPTASEAIQVDPDLLESQLRIARLLAYGPLATGAGE